MKKLTSMALALVLCVLVLSVSAQNVTTTVIPATLTRNNPQGNRTYPDNPLIPGESPTTGLPVGNHSYMPILVQIDNTPGAMPQWGLAAADIVYEMPLAEPGWTRLTALFSDTYPEEAGPVRSGRLMHADLREEWDGPIVFYGAQTDEGSDMKAALRQYGANKKNLSIDGVANKYAKDLLKRVKYHYAPHNVTVHVAQLRDFLIKDTDNYQFVPRPYQFTDAPAYNGPAATSVEIKRRDNKETAATYVYDAAINAYARHNFKGPYTDLLAPDTPFHYSNVIVQRTKVGYNGHTSMPLLPNVVGSGAADIFIAGRYIAGSWTRSGLKDRTVFLDEQGNELQLMRGKTWIVVGDEATQVQYSSDPNAPAPQVIAITDRVLTPDEIAAQEHQAATEQAEAAAREAWEQSMKEQEEAAAKEAQAQATTQPQQAPITPATTVLPAPPLATVAPAGSTATATAVPQQVTPVTPVATAAPQATEAPEVAPMPELPAHQVEPETPEIQYATVVTRNKGDLNFREGQGTNTKRIGIIPYQAQVQVLERGDEWTKIIYKEKEGYVMTTYLVFDEQ